MSKVERGNIKLCRVDGGLEIVVWFGCVWSYIFVADQLRV